LGVPDRHRGANAGAVSGKARAAPRRQLLRSQWVVRASPVCSMTTWAARQATLHTRCLMAAHHVAIACSGLRCFWPQGQPAKSCDHGDLGRRGVRSAHSVAGRQTRMIDWSILDGCPSPVSDGCRPGDDGRTAHAHGSRDPHCVREHAAHAQRPPGARLSDASCG